MKSSLAFQQAPPNLVAFRKPLNQAVEMIFGPTNIPGTRRQEVSPLLTGFRRNTRTDIMQPFGQISPPTDGGKMISYITLEILRPVEIVAAIMSDRGPRISKAIEAERVLRESEAFFSPMQINAFLRETNGGCRHLVAEGHANLFPVMVEQKREQVIRMFRLEYTNQAWRGHRLARIGLGRGTNPSAIIHLRNPIRTK